MPKCFHDAREFRVMADHLVCVIHVLNVGRTKGILSSSIHASSRGYSIKLNGVTIAKGSTPDELHKNYMAEVDKANFGRRKTE